MGSSISNPGAGEPERPEVVNNPKPDEAELQKQARQTVFLAGWLWTASIHVYKKTYFSYVFSLCSEIWYAV